MTLRPIFRRFAFLFLCAYSRLRQIFNNFNNSCIGIVVSKFAIKRSLKVSPSAVESGKKYRNKMNNATACRTIFFGEFMKQPIKKVKWKIIFKNIQTLYTQ